MCKDSSHILLDVFDMLGIGIFLFADSEHVLLETAYTAAANEMQVNLVTVDTCSPFVILILEADTEEAGIFVFSDFVDAEKGRNVGEEVVCVIHSVILCYLYMK